MMDRIGVAEAVLLPLLSEHSVPSGVSGSSLRERLRPPLEAQEDGAMIGQPILRLREAWVNNQEAHAQARAPRPGWNYRGCRATHQVTHAPSFCDGMQKQWKVEVAEQQGLLKQKSHRKQQGKLPVDATLQRL
jgi:hypothetical protein